MKFLLYSLCLPIFLVQFAANPAFGKKRAPNLVRLEDLASINVTIVIKQGKREKSFSKELYCNKDTPGEVKKKNGSLGKFTSLSQKIRLLKKKKNKRKITLYKKFNSAAKKLCSDPSNQLLSQYTGRFGAAEARLLYDHFAFGASEEDVQFAVANGLDATVDKLTSFYAIPQLDEAEADLRCDAVFGGEGSDEGKECDQNNPNDLSVIGVRYGLYWRFLKSPLPYFEKLFMVLHDRIPASERVLSSCQRYALPRHVDLLRKYAIDGNYYNLMKEMISDNLMLDWLDGAKNIFSSPNENFSREFWELFTLGTNDLEGNPIYTPIDVAEAARAFSGWSIESYELNDNYVCFPAYFPDLHDQGEKIIFQDTPYQTVVYDELDVLDATFAHPSAAEDLAKHLWLEYVNPNPSNAVIKRLASILRENHFNIHSVLKTLMKSNALYSTESKKSLIKDPVDFIFGFLRTTKIPVPFYKIKSQLEKMGQSPLSPVSVFGWYPVNLAGEGYQVEARNTLIYFLYYTSYLKENDFSFHDYLEDGMSSLEAINRLSGLLNVDLNQAQIDHLDQFLNYKMRYDNTLERQQFDSNIDAENIWWNKTANLIYLLGSTYQYRMK